MRSLWCATVRVAAICLACGAAAGCGFDSNESSSQQSPPEQCRDYVTGYCAKMVECALPSDRSRASEDCAFNFEVYLACDDTRAVAGSMRTCLDDLAAVDCKTVTPPGSWPSTPETCKILVLQ